MPYFLRIGLLAATICMATLAGAQPSVLYDAAKEQNRQKIALMPPDAQLQVAPVTITGNKITKAYIIMRELPFRPGEHIVVSQLEQLLDAARENVMNTQVFLEVVPTIEAWDATTIHIKIDVKERWYIFPLPYFKLIDRNPNQWLVEQNASLDRVNYGLKFMWENVSGRRDKLNINIINGYTRQFGLYYEQPYADKKLEQGFLGGMYFAQSRQMSFATDSNKQVFYPAANNQMNDFVRSTFRAEAGYSIRKGISHRHAWRLAYVSERIPDTVNRIIESNAQKGYLPYFNNNATHQRFAELQYTYQYFKVNNIPYPWRGTAFSGMFLQRGLGMPGMNLWQVQGKLGRYFPIGEHTSVALMGLGMLKLPFRQPQYNLQALGYLDFYMRGLEYYVIDGVMAGIAKATLRREILELRVPTLFLKSEKYRKIPFKIIAKIYGDAGGVHTPYFNNSILANRLLYTWGGGIDVLSYYDFVARFEYSFNQLGEKGLFLHLRRDF
jgi:hypothetical protein